ncbi:MAG: prevent-host-death protein [Gammaproteobacteria bacterium]|nr:MAG: prevent-host-death protein [Gammaproteobacteria bacterium]RKZ71815.1 MAG: prevent-host-death protein [Gammaproteobacteria bacterium]
MKSIQISEDIFPLGQFKTHASRVLRNLHEKNRPIIITQNGKPAAVLLTPEEFDRLSKQEQFVAAVKEGLQDVKAGNIISDEELSTTLREEFGIS